MLNPDEAWTATAMAIAEIERRLASSPPPAESDAFKAAKNSLLDVLDQLAIDAYRKAAESVNAASLRLQAIIGSVQNDPLATALSRAAKALPSVQIVGSSSSAPSSSNIPAPAGQVPAARQDRTTELGGAGRAMSGSDILDKAKVHIGEKYILGARAPLSNSNWRGPWDCAEYASWLAYQTYGIIYGCGNTSNAESAEPFTGNWMVDADNRGVKITVAQAIAMPGSFLLRLPVGSGPNKRIGHIAICIGDGRVYEAAGSQLGVRIGPTEGRRWDVGILLPGVTYTAGAGPAGLTGPVPLVLRQNDPSVFDDRVVELQSALKQRGFDPGKIDGLFGSTLEAAVVAFQLSQGMIVDGEVGQLTGQALGLPFWPSVVSQPAATGVGAQAISPIPVVASLMTDASGTVVNNSVGYSTIRAEYAKLFDSCIVQDKNGEIGELARRVGVNQQRYSDLVANFRGQANENIPWYFVALIHAMEASGDIGRFKCHLHNGDPLNRPTVNVPKDRPNATGSNFSWEESARDALELEGFNSETDWSLPRMLYRLEKYNGFGPRKRRHATAYLWSYSNHYIKGKFIADHVWDDNAISKQPGCATILKRLVETRVVQL